MSFRKILWAVVILVVLLGAYRIIVKVTTKKVQAERVFPVVVQAPRTGELQYKVTLTGDVKAQAG